MLDNISIIRIILTMTKKHYIETAKIIKGQRPEYNEEDGYSDSDARLDDALDMVARGMSYLFSRDNPNFDSVKFLSAAGVE